MSKYDKLLFQILRGTADANISFDDLCRLLEKIGFEERIRSSHHTFRKDGVVEKINCNAMAIRPKSTRYARCGQCY